MKPTLPPHLQSRRAGWKEDCDKLWKDICVEVCDPKYQKHTHNNYGTYNAGCRGPACKYAERRRYRSHRSNAKKPRPLIDAKWEKVIDFYYNAAQEQIDAHKSELFERLTG